jgi:hypothetical protein
MLHQVLQKAPASAKGSVTAIPDYNPCKILYWLTYTLPSVAPFNSII